METDFVNGIDELPLVIQPSLSRNVVEVAYAKCTMKALGVGRLVDRALRYSTKHGLIGHSPFRKLSCQ